eukprot:1688531-Amphidinium_carterae.1
MGPNHHSKKLSKTIPYGGKSEQEQAGFELLRVLLFIHLCGELTIAHAYRGLLRLPPGASATWLKGIFH